MTDVMEQETTATEEAEPVRPESVTVYVVQRREEGLAEGLAGATTVWVDLARVVLPAKSKRISAIPRALEEAGLTEDQAGALRVLDVDSAEVWEQEEEQKVTKVWKRGV
jgi:hypothetical protein